MQNMPHFKQRLLFSFIGISLIFILIYYSQNGWIRPLFATIASGMIAGSVWEYYRVAKRKGLRPLKVLGILTSFFFVMAIFINTQLPSPSLLPEITLTVALISSFLTFFIKGSDPFVNLAVTAFGIGYLPIPLSCIIRINYFFPPEALQDGRIWLFYLLAVSKCTDIGAYFIGKAFGKKPLAPYISPRKTWLGAVGGALAALMTSLLFWFFFQESSAFNLSFTTSIALGLTLGIAAQVGDLSESLLKRDCGVKDSNQLPGLGGMLDMVDSLVFTSPILFLFLKGITS